MNYSIATGNRAGTWLRALAMLLACALLLPYLITPFYLLLRPVSTPMLWRWFLGERVERIWLPIEAMSPALPAAVLVAEDARFCQHSGIDWHGVQTAIEEAEDGEIRGASSITQQVAKNLFLWPGRSYLRKALEFPLALWIDLVLGKRRVLEIYLNIAEWGPNGEFGANPVRRNAGRVSPVLLRLAALYEMRALRSPQVDACLWRRVR